MARRKSRRPPGDLPQLAEMWSASVRLLRTWITPPNEDPYRPFVLLVFNWSNGVIQRSEILDKAPEAEMVLASLLEAMRKPPRGTRQKPHRPQQIRLETTDSALGKRLETELATLDITLEMVAHVDVFDEIVQELEEHLRGGPEIPGLLSVKGVTPELVGGIFAAAAEFYRAEPWIQLNDSQPLAVQVPPEKEPRFVHLMGSGGMEYGVAVYRRWEDVERLFGFSDNPLEVLPPDGGNSFIFEEIMALPFDDLEALEKYGWEVVDDMAYPIPLVYTREGEAKRPTAADLRWYEAALRAVPRFVDQHLQQADTYTVDNPLEVALTVPTQAGEVTVQIKYPGGELPVAARPADFGDWAEWDDDEDYDDDDEAGGLMFDRRAMESVWGQFGMGFDDPTLQEAQQLMYQAWDESNPGRRLILAHEALSVSPDCADAYVLLAEEEADTVGRALEYYQKGVEAGERALGKKFFKENAGHFWGILETRPYMRARQGLANILWDMGRIEEAASHYKDMLTLNPGDNQGVRYSLLNLLLAANRDDEAQALLDQYDEDAMAEWLYSRALLEFRARGESRAANEALQEALQTNAHVPAYLTGRKRIPNRLPDFIGWGDENEAIVYASGHLPIWRKTPGAVDWLKTQVGQPGKGRSSGRGKGKKIK